LLFSLQPSTISLETTGKTIAQYLANNIRYIFPIPFYESQCKYKPLCLFPQFNKVVFGKINPVPGLLQHKALYQEQGKKSQSRECMVIQADLPGSEFT
jgi:hypothetical protein